jgi:hypothetical protein
MAEKLCQLKKKGLSGEFQETILWTNPNPTTGFESRTVNLSESVRNFKYIKATIRKSTTDNTVRGIIADIDTFTASTTDSPVSYSFMFGSGRVVRAVRYTTDTSVLFGNALGINSTTAGGVNYCIPYQIIGLK